MLDGGLAAVARGGPVFEVDRGVAGVGPDGARQRRTRRADGGRGPGGGAGWRDLVRAGVAGPSGRPRDAALIGRRALRGEGRHELDRGAAGLNAIVWVGPPLFWSGPSSGFGPGGPRQGSAKTLWPPLTMESGGAQAGAPPPTVSVGDVERGPRALAEVENVATGSGGAAGAGATAAAFASATARSSLHPRSRKAFRGLVSRVLQGDGEDRPTVAARGAVPPLPPFPLISAPGPPVPPWPPVPAELSANVTFVRLT